jgi:hypothetical protein
MNFLLQIYSKITQIKVSWKTLVIKLKTSYYMYVKVWNL